MWSKGAKPSGYTAVHPSTPEYTQGPAEGRRGARPESGPEYLEVVNCPNTAMALTNQVFVSHDYFQDCQRYTESLEAYLDIEGIVLSVRYPLQLQRQLHHVLWIQSVQIFFPELCRRGENYRVENCEAAAASGSLFSKAS